MPENIRVGSPVNFMDINGRFGYGIVRGVDRETYGQFVYVIEVRSMRGESDPVPVAYAAYSDVWLASRAPDVPSASRQAYLDYVQRIRDREAPWLDMEYNGKGY